MIAPESIPSLRRFLSLEFSAGGNPVTRIVAQRAGALLAWLAAHARLTPNQVTLFAFAASLSGAAVYALAASAVALTWAFVLTQLGYALDCADGQLARATRSTSALGRWLDSFLDMGTISSLAFAAIYRIVEMQPELAAPAFICGFAYCFARSGDLLTCTLARTAIGSGTATQKSWPRLLFLVAIDTPVVLLAIVVLHDRPMLLAAALACFAALFFIHALYVGIATARRGNAG